MEQAEEQGRRPRRRRPGGGLTDKQERFVRLIEQGVSNSEACRMAGINRRTGTRWRFGRTIQDTAGQPVHYPPVSAPRPPKPRHPRYLSPAERLTIADLRRETRTLHETAAAIGRNTSTISRELRRNAELHAVVVELLGKRWSIVQAGTGRTRVAGAVPRPSRTAAVYRVP